VLSVCVVVVEVVDEVSKNSHEAPKYPSAQLQDHTTSLEPSSSGSATQVPPFKQRQCGAVDDVTRGAVVVNRGVVVSCSSHNEPA
jgi:hypothetical protein